MTTTITSFYNSIRISQKEINIGIITLINIFRRYILDQYHIELYKNEILKIFYEIGLRVTRTSSIEKYTVYQVSKKKIGTEIRHITNNMISNALKQPLRKLTSESIAMLNLHPIKNQLESPVSVSITGNSDYIRNLTSYIEYALKVPIISYSNSNFILLEGALKITRNIFKYVNFIF